MKTEAPRDWICRSLVRMLVTEKENYAAAAEVISGCEDTLQMHRNRIAECVETVCKPQDLERVLEDARMEISDCRSFEAEVFEYAAGVRPIKEAFNKIVIQRNLLLQEVMQAHDRWLANQAKKFKVS